VHQTGHPAGHPYPGVYPPGHPSGHPSQGQAHTSGSTSGSSTGAGDLTTSGTYSTAILDREAAALRARGWSEPRIAQDVYVPFIVEGPASWSNTWGAPRYAGGFHLHEGQDVFCNLGAPVLATEAGKVQFDTNTLGGNVARLIRPDGSYWYYAHLSGWNLSLKSGQEVTTGTVLGYCGNTGDAAGGPTHVHFGEYSAAGVASDPMAALIGWLHTAEARLGVVQSTPAAASLTSYEPGAAAATSAPDITTEGPVSVGVPLVSLMRSSPNLVERSAMWGGAALPFGIGAMWLSRRRKRRIVPGGDG
jgi:murein DD-endopeptidase MepM/ murein hydrolase activator NlpD